MLKNILGLKNAKLPTDKIDAHKNPDNLDKHLTKKSIKNLKKWYSRDYDFVSICDNLYIK